MNFLDFVNKKNNNLKQDIVFNEAFRNSDAPLAIEKIIGILKKNIKNLFAWKHPFDTVIGGKQCKSYLLYQKRGVVISLNFSKEEKSTEVYSIDFFENIFQVLNSNKSKSKLTIYTMGTSVAYFIPIIAHVVNERDFNLSNETAEKIAQQKTNESLDYYYGNACFKTYYNATNIFIQESFRNTINEKADKEVRDYKSKKFGELKQIWNEVNGTPRDNPRRKDVRKMENEYEKIKDAIRGGVENMDELKMALEHGVEFALANRNKEEKLPDESKNVKDINPEQTDKPALIEVEEGPDPEQTFKIMSKYVKTVCKGIQPGLIVCGAPGVGKTFRVKQELNAMGYKEDVNMFTFKGRGGAQGLYTACYNFRKKGEIILVDDCDNLLKDEIAINIFKGALDSTADEEGRVLSYNIRGKVFDLNDQPVPKKFYYNGSMIVLTNFAAGQLDTAIKGRTFVQDIHFSTQQTLDLIKDMIKKISGDNITLPAKYAAYDYLVKLSEEKPEMKDCLSIRTFITCARLYQLQLDDDDLSDEDVEFMIAQQMELQSARGGKKY